MIALAFSLKKFLDFSSISAISSTFSQGSKRLIMRNSCHEAETVYQITEKYWNATFPPNSHYWFTLYSHGTIIRQQKRKKKFSLGFMYTNLKDGNGKVDVTISPNTDRFKLMLIVTKLINIAVKDFDKRSARYIYVFIVSGTQCTWYVKIISLFSDLTLHKAKIVWLDLSLGNEKHKNKNVKQWNYYQPMYCGSSHKQYKHLNMQQG